MKPTGWLAGRQTPTEPQGQRLLSCAVSGAGHVCTAAVRLYYACPSSLKYDMCLTASVDIQSESVSFARPVEGPTS